jgi:large subunit ribosomal protein L10
VIQDFIKEKKKAAVRGGKLQRQLLTPSDIDRLSALPSREQLIAQLVGAMASPIQGLANVLNGPIRGLVIVIGQIQEKQSSAA